MPQGRVTLRRVVAGRTGSCTGSPTSGSGRHAWTRLAVAWRPVDDRNGRRTRAMLPVRPGEPPLPMPSASQPRSTVEIVHRVGRNTGMPL